jgi:hypothetical protein
MKPIRSLMTSILAASLVLGACSKKPSPESKSPAADNAAQSSQPATESAGQASQAAQASQPSQPPQPSTDRSQTPPSKTARAAAPPREVAKTPPPLPKPKPVVIPAGTVITVRIQQPVGSKTSHEGDRFDASIAQPITIGGKTVVPTGSSASGQVTEAHPAGKFKGGATLGLTLTSLHVAGSNYAIQSAAVSQESKGKGKRTATMVGGGAAAGALIGGLAGGGKGAAIGALVGGGAGTAGAAYTGNRDISLPAESALTFKLTAPLTLKPQTEVTPDSTRQ